jgi:hypothetical protein
MAENFAAVSINERTIDGNILYDVARKAIRNDLRYPLAMR